MEAADLVSAQILYHPIWDGKKYHSLVSFYGQET